MYARYRTNARPSVPNEQLDVCQEFNIFLNLVESIGPHSKEILNYHNDDGLDNYVEDVIRKYSSQKSITK